MDFFLFAVWFAAVVSCYDHDGYAPYKVQCPSTKLTRDATTVSTMEKAWLSKRDSITQRNLAMFLKQAGLNSSEYSSLLGNNNTIRIGIAASGGSYRAMLTGAGQVAALDSRTPNATKNALGGILQSSTYFSGVSGGNWLLASMVFNNWTSVSDIISGKTDVWNLEHSIVTAHGWNVFKDLGDYKNLLLDLYAKHRAGFKITITDLWGRALSHQFFSKKTGYGVGTTWSNIQSEYAFSEANMPFPISISNIRFNQTIELWNESVVMETNPFEFGSWDTSLSSFTNIKYLGTKMVNGVSASGDCYSGLDNSGFLMGASSSVFDSFLDQAKVILSKVKYIGSFANEMIDDLLNGKVQATIEPNPFFELNFNSPKAAVNTSNEVISSDHLSLVDGGTDYENIPIQPLINPDRKVDIIFALDSSGDDAEVWPNGDALYFTYSRQFTGRTPSGFSFPPVPLPTTFVARNYTKRPVFFGCDASQLTQLSSIPPLVVYSANAHYSFASNTSTMKMSYSDKERGAMIQNGYELMSRNNLTDDSSFQGCVACAVIKRAQEREGVEQSEFCKSCFKQYCWDGTN